MKTRFVGVRAGPREVDEATSAAKLMSERAQDVAKQARAGNRPVTGCVNRVFGPAKQKKQPKNRFLWLVVGSINTDVLQVKFRHQQSYYSIQEW